MASFPLTVTATTIGYRSYKNPLNKAPLRTVTGRGNDPRLFFRFRASGGELNFPITIIAGVTVIKILQYIVAKPEESGKTTFAL